MFRAVDKTNEVDSNNKQILTEHQKQLMENVINTQENAGYKKRFKHYDDHQIHLDYFMNNHAVKVHEEIVKAAIAVGMIEEDKI